MPRLWWPTAQSNMPSSLRLYSTLSLVSERRLIKYSRLLSMALSQLLFLLFKFDLERLASADKLLLQLFHRLKITLFHGLGDFRFQKNLALSNLGSVFGIQLGHLLFLFFSELDRRRVLVLSLIHISEPTRLLSISYAVFCL